MKHFAIAALAASILATPVLAGPYIAAEGVFQSVSLDSATTDRVPHDLTGEALEAGWRLGRFSLGGQYASTSANQNGNSLSDTRYAITAAYHFTVIPGVDTYVQADGGRAAYSAVGTNNFPKPPSVLFHGTSNDWGVGLGVDVPVWKAVSIRATGGYRDTNFAGHGGSGVVAGIGLVLAR